MAIAEKRKISDAAQTLRVMSLNLRFGLADDGPNSWNYRRRAYAPLLKSHPGDFYAFQEANDFQISFLAGMLPDYGFIGKRSPAPDFWQNNIIFFHRRWQVIAHEHFYLSDTPDVPSKFCQSKWPRQCTLGVFQYNRRKLIVINTHLDFESEVQIRSAKLICMRLAGQSGNLPAVLMGDFNTTPASQCYTIFTSVKENTDPCFHNAFERPYPGTHHGFSGRSQGGSIDWILYRGPLEVESAQVITHRFNGIYPSDHFPITVTFAWK